MKTTVLKVLTKSGAEKIFYVSDPFTLVVERLNADDNDELQRKHPASLDQRFMEFTNAVTNRTIALRRGYIYAVEQSEKEVFTNE